MDEALLLLIYISIMSLDENVTEFPAAASSPPPPPN